MAEGSINVNWHPVTTGVNSDLIRSLVNLPSAGSALLGGLQDTFGQAFKNEKDISAQAWTNHLHNQQLAQETFKGIADAWINSHPDEYASLLNEASSGPEGFQSAQAKIAQLGLPIDSGRLLRDEQENLLSKLDTSRKSDAETNNFNANAQKAKIETRKLEDIINAGLHLRSEEANIKAQEAQANEAEMRARQIELEKVNPLELDEKFRKARIALDNEGSTWKNLVLLYRNGESAEELVRRAKQDPRFAEFSPEEIYRGIQKSATAGVDPLLKDTAKTFSDSVFSAIDKSHAAYAARTPVVGTMAPVLSGELDPATSVLVSKFGKDVTKNTNFSDVQQYLLGESTKLLKAKNQEDTPENRALAIQAILNSSFNPDNNTFPDIFSKILTSDKKLSEKINYNWENAKTLLGEASSNWEKHSRLYKRAYGANGLLTKSFWQTTINQATTRASRGDGSFAENIERIAKKRYYDALKDHNLTNEDISELSKAYEQILAGFTPTLRSGLDPNGVVNSGTGTKDQPSVDLTKQPTNIKKWSSETLHVASQDKNIPETDKKIYREQYIEKASQTEEGYSQALDTFVSSPDTSSQEFKDAVQILKKGAKRKITGDSFGISFRTLAGRILIPRMQELNYQLSELHKQPQTTIVTEKIKELNKQLKRFKEYLAEESK